MAGIYGSGLPMEYSFDFTNLGRLRRGASQMLNSGNEAPTFATEFYINDETISNSFGQALDPLYADWIDMALAVYVADRMSPRRGPGLPFQWARRLSLRIPVRLPEVWIQPNVRDSLGKVLSYFTDDAWTIEFVARRGLGRIGETHRFLFPSPISQPVRVVLLSGGLDSFAGAAREVAELCDHSFVFVSGATNSRQRVAQRDQARALGRLSRLELCHITIPFGISRDGRSRGQGEEVSQRTRGFLFLTLGAVTAIAAGAPELYVNENGIGAINLPYDATQLGTSNSRSVHPISLLRMGEFVEALTSRPFAFNNPFLYETKGQMCQHPSVHGLADYISATFSCDGFPVQARGKPQCGSCTSCLLRRLSLEAAGLSAYDPGDLYVCDLSSPSVKASPKQLQHLNAMEWQFRKIAQRLGSADPWHSVVTEFTELRNIASELGSRTGGGEEEVRRLLLKMYARYVAEFEKSAARVRLANQTRAA